MERLREVWRTEDRLHTDDATVARLCALAAVDPSIQTIITELRAIEPGNGSVWASGTACADGRPALLKLGARRSEREWMTHVDSVTADVVPHVYGSGALADVGWLVLEDCPERLGPLVDSHMKSVVSAAARYQRAGATGAASAEEMDATWLHTTLSAAAEAACPGPIDAAIATVDRTWSLVVTACGLTANHGDVHFGNVVARRTGGPALLIDPMPIHTVWAWDAAYLEATAVTRVPGLTGLVRDLAAERHRLGAPAPGDLTLVETAVLGWAAAHWWRIAPWRHDTPRWRQWVGDRVHALSGLR